MTITRLEPVGSREVPDPELEAAGVNREQQVALQVIMLALKALSQRAVVALAALFTLLTVGSVFWLWLAALPTMGTNQIIGISLYSLFVLAINVYGVRK